SIFYYSPLHPKPMLRPYSPPPYPDVDVHVGLVAAKFVREDDKVGVGSIGFIREDDQRIYGVSHMPTPSPRPPIRSIFVTHPSSSSKLRSFSSLDLVPIAFFLLLSI
ncbi:unnamed protein product, partial [Dovyalis caffra]